MRRLCQLEITSLLLLVCLFSCAGKYRVVKNIDKAKAVPPSGVKIKPNWFRAPDRFAFTSSMGGMATHPFFDITPVESRKKRLLYFYPLTWEGSNFGYSFDMISGRRLRNFDYCPKTDVWQSYKDSIHLPPYTEGIVPRMLNPFGEPLKMIVFGKIGSHSNDGLGNVYATKVRVVGGVIRQYCRDYPCDSGRRWKSSLLLVGVSRDDPEMEKISELSQLKAKVKWSYVKAFLANSGGRKVGLAKELPAYRITGEVDASQSMAFVFRHGLNFTVKDMNNLRKSCFKLYDYIWKSVVQVKKDAELLGLNPKQYGQKQIKVKENSSKANLLSFSKDKNSLDKLAKDLKEYNLLTFDKWFWNFYEKYGENFHTCSKFVRPANLRNDLERHWFFAYLSNFFNLEKLGYYYDCEDKLWVHNPARPQGKRAFKLGVKRKCTNSQLDQAFDTGVTLMESLRASGGDHYRYVEYDDGIGGSHERLHNWVFFRGKTWNCEQTKARKIEAFPKDVRWTSLRVKVSEEALGSGIIE